MVGIVLITIGSALVANWRGAADWWVDYSVRQRDLWGRWIGPDYSEGGVRQLGIAVALLGLLFLAGGVWAISASQRIAGGLCDTVRVVDPALSPASPREPRPAAPYR